MSVQSVGRHPGSQQDSEKWMVLRIAVGSRQTFVGCAGFCRSSKYETGEGCSM